ncbi:MAG: ferritin [Deltaproteobacteria bacterium]|nr:ferritin [Deltaproteobacteria bacterium]
MISNKMETAINGQINIEVYSSYLYYAMAAYFEKLSLKGFAHWMRIQALEELTHVQKLITFINDRGGEVKLETVEAPPLKWESPLAALEATYKHEVMVTGLINNLMDTAFEAKDHAAVNFLQWFVAEQVEEEASVDEAVQRLKLVRQSEGGLFLVDREMDNRTFTLPADLVGVF